MNQIISKSPTEEYATACYYLIKEVGVSLDEIRNLEVNSFQALCQLYAKDLKLQKKAQSKGKKNFG